MSMPANAAPQAQAYSADFSDAGITRTKTILLVEDETFVREVASEVLRAAGYSVIPAKNAADATRCYQRQKGRIDLLLTDLVLPDQNGSALAKALHGRNPTLKLLFVTGYAEQMNRGLDLDELLAKPFSKRLLLEKVSRILNAEISDSLEGPAYALLR